MKVKIKGVLLAVIVLSCFALQASAAEDPLSDGWDTIKDPTGHSSLWIEMGGPTDDDGGIKEDVQESMRNEDIFNISAETGMSPEVSAGTVVQTSTIPEDADVSGNWSFELTDNLTGDLDLTLFQVGSVVFGNGQIAINESDLVATASGIIDGNKLDLDVVTLEDVTLYKLNLNVATRSISGSYVVYNVEGGSFTGAAVGRPQV